jgi:hypothetical protein
MISSIGLSHSTTARAWVDDIKVWMSVKVGRKTMYAEVPHKVTHVVRQSDGIPRTFTDIHTLVLEPECDFLGCIDLMLPLHGRTLDEAVLWISMHVDDDVFDVCEGPGLQALIDASCVLKGDPRRVVVSHGVNNDVEHCLVPIVTYPVGFDDLFACQLGTTMTLRVAMSLKTTTHLRAVNWFSFTSLPSSTTSPTFDFQVYGTQHWLTERCDVLLNIKDYDVLANVCGCSIIEPTFSITFSMALVGVSWRFYNELWISI